MIPSRAQHHPTLETFLNSASSPTATTQASFLSPDSFIGDKMTPNKPPNTTRMFFANVNGLRFGPQGGDFIDLCAQMDISHIDLLGIAETKLDTQNGIVAATCAKAARRIFSFSRVVMASSAIRYAGTFKPGGTALITAGCTTGRIATTFRDSMGRWCAVSFLGAQNKIITVISAYQVCDTPP
jgi:hypothetical protein